MSGACCRVYVKVIVRIYTTTKKLREVERITTKEYQKNSPRIVNYQDQHTLFL
jgi:hypothetical protein